MCLSAMFCTIVKWRLVKDIRFSDFELFCNLLQIYCPQKHDPPLSSIPCLHYKKMKDNEEREQSSELTPSGEVSPIKPLSRSTELEFSLEEPDPMGADSGPPDEKDPLGAEAAPGALGQVKAKVEVCKDESVGKFS